MRAIRLTSLLTGLLFVLADVVTAGPAGAAQGGERDDRWSEVKPMYFADRPIADAGEVIALEAPGRAHDAALVPVKVTSRLPADSPRRIRAITLIVEGNPIPMVGRFHFPSERRVSELATRVRVESYTHVRAVAEMDDGSLLMTGTFVKASGGCSAPAMKDPEAVMARLGRMKLRTPAGADPYGILQAQAMISHPNYNGMQFDQITRTYIPADFVDTIEIGYAGEPLIVVDADVSMSEDPSIRFTFDPGGPGAFTLRVRDSKGRSFEGRWDPFEAPGAS